MRIGYTIAGRSWMYTHAVPRAADLAPRHSVLKQWDLLEPLGIRAGDPAANPMEMARDVHAAAFVERRLREAGIDTHPLVVIHVSAGNPFRRWPAGVVRGADLPRSRGATRERRFVLTSGPSQAAAALWRSPPTPG